MIRAVVITVSDRCASGLAQDESGPTLTMLLQAMGARVVAAIVVPDDLEPLAEKLRAFADDADINLVITTGGTGFSPRDNTPEATRAVIQKEAPGLAEAMRMETLKQTPLAMTSRGVCGIRSNALIINLPGSPKAVRESFAVIKPVLAHAISLLSGKPHVEAEDERRETSGSS
ncbi:MAG: MogA/MoaB family molybdenum cofactor biosynthesis protein [Pyrinomonadaceae bacterium]|nr:MogA/MoaB family molybdenum cofactor biosynthesis protein [Pyrinomonadaceae bacterium]